MSINTTSAVHRQVAAVQRRLLVQSLIRTLAWTWFAALALSAVWFLVEPLLFQPQPGWLRWTVLAASIVAGTAAAVAFAVRGRATPTQAALALDEQFRLKERVTTSLLLRPDEAVSPAGAALLADANQRVDPLRVGERFPVRVPWTAALAPVAAVGLFLVIYFYHPDFTKAQAPTPEQRIAAMKAEIQKELDPLQKQVETHKKDPAKSEQLQKAEADADDLVVNKRETPEDVQKAIQKADEAKDQLSKLKQANADQQRDLKEQLDRMERAARDKQDAADLAKKLDAAQQADELKKKVAAEKDPEKKQALQDELKKKEEAAIKPEDRDKAQQQLKDLKDDADRLEQDNKDAQQQLAEKEKKQDEEAKKDGADKDQLQKEKDKIEKEKQALQDQQKDLKDAGQKLADAQKAMDEKKDGQAAQQLQQAGDKISQAGKDDDLKKAGQELKDKQAEGNRIAQDLKQVQDAKKGLADGLAKQEGQDGNQDAKAGDQGGKPGDQGGKAGNDQGDGDGANPQNQGGIGSGARPQGNDGGTGTVDAQIRTDPNDKVKPTVTGDADGGQHDRFSGPKKPEDMKDDIRRAAQEGEAAADNERVTDKGSADTSKEWFRAIRPPDKPAPPK